MIYSPEKYKKEYHDINKELMELKGILNDKEAKISLVKFLRSNLGFTTELISGIKLALSFICLLSLSLLFTFKSFNSFC